MSTHSALHPLGGGGEADGASAASAAEATAATGLDDSDNNNYTYDYSLYIATRRQQGALYERLGKFVSELLGRMVLGVDGWEEVLNMKCFIPTNKTVDNTSLQHCLNMALHQTLCCDISSTSWKDTLCLSWRTAESASSVDHGCVNVTKTLEAHLPDQGETLRLKLEIEFGIPSYRFTFSAFSDQMISVRGRVEKNTSQQQQSLHHQPDYYEYLIKQVFGVVDQGSYRVMLIIEKCNRLPLLRKNSDFECMQTCTDQEDILSGVHDAMCKALGYKHMQYEMHCPSVSEKENGEDFHMQLTFRLNAVHADQIVFTWFETPKPSVSITCCICSPSVDKLLKRGPSNTLQKRQWEEWNDDSFVQKRRAMKLVMDWTDEARILDSIGIKWMGGHEAPLPKAAAAAGSESTSATTTPRPDARKEGMSVVTDVDNMHVDGEEEEESDREYSMKLDYSSYDFFFKDALCMFFTSTSQDLSCKSNLGHPTALTIPENFKLVDMLNTQTRNALSMCRKHANFRGIVGLRAWYSSAGSTVRQFSAHVLNTDSCIQVRIEQVDRILMKIVLEITKREMPLDERLRCYIAHTFFRGNRTTLPKHACTVMQATFKCAEEYADRGPIISRACDCIQDLGRQHYTSYEMMTRGRNMPNDVFMVLTFRFDDASQCIMIWRKGSVSVKLLLLEGGVDDLFRTLLVEEEAGRVQTHVMITPPTNGGQLSTTTTRLMQQMPSSSEEDEVNMHSLYEGATICAICNKILRLQCL
jgi:hypothetical protein